MAGFQKPVFAAWTSEKESGRRTKITDDVLSTRADPQF